MDQGVDLSLRTWGELLRHCENCGAVIRQHSAKDDDGNEVIFQYLSIGDGDKAKYSRLPLGWEPGRRVGYQRWALVCGELGIPSPPRWWAPPM